MIRKILLFLLLLLLFSNTIEASQCSQAQENLNITCFHKNCAQSGGLLLSKSRICIPQKFKPFIQTRPAEDDAKVDIYIDIANIQVIEIDAHTLTVSMHLTTTWGEFRLKLFTRSWEERIFLSTHEQKEMWLPYIVFATNMVSQNMQGEEIFIWKKMGPVRPPNFIPSTHVANNIFLTSRVKCEMEFQDFPFDKHVCKLEVKYR